MARFRNPWDREEEIATAFRSALEVNGWVVYPETNGYDLFAVAGKGTGVHPGDQLGVECKLDAGTAGGWTSLVRQIVPLPSRYGWPSLGTPSPFAAGRNRQGPRYRAAVTSRFADEELLHTFGVITFAVALDLDVAFASRRISRRVAGLPSSGWVRIEEEELVDCVRRRLGQNAPRHAAEPLPVPEIIVDVPAGVPSPRKASAWKVEAVRLYLRLESGERLTSRELGRHSAFFRACGYVEDTGERRGRFHLYGPGRRPDVVTPPERWPEIAAALRKKDLQGEVSEREAE